MEHTKEKNQIKIFLFKNERGYVVLPELEKRDIFDIGDIISISITPTNQLCLKTATCPKSQSSASKVR